MFCLEDLSIFDSGVLKFPTISMFLSTSFLKFSKIFLIYLGAPVLGAFMFIMCMSSWWILPLSIVKWPSGPLCMAFVLKSILSDISIATLAFFSYPFAWEICFQPFTFSLCRSFVPRWVHRQHMCGSCFLIHSAILCLWLDHLIHLCLRLLSRGSYSLPFFPICVPLSFSFPSFP